MLVRLLTLCSLLLAFASEVRAGVVSLSDYWNGDEASLQEAFDQAAVDAGAEGIIRLGRRAYQTDRPLDLAGPVTVVGMGATRSKIAYTGDRADAVVMLSGTGVRMSGLGISGGGVAELGISAGQVDDVTLHDVSVSKLGSATSVGVLASSRGEQGLSIRSCTFRDFGLCGVFVGEGSQSFEISDSDFVRAGTDLVPRFGILVEQDGAILPGGNSLITRNYVDVMGVASIAVSNVNGLTISENELLGGSSLDVSTQAVAIADFSSDVEVSHNVLADLAGSVGVSVGQGKGPSVRIAVDNNAFTGFLQTGMEVGDARDVSFTGNVFEFAPLSLFTTESAVDEIFIGAEGAGNEVLSPPSVSAAE